MDVKKHDPESQSVTVALAWAPGMMGAVPWTWESQGRTRHILFSLFSFFLSFLFFIYFFFFFNLQFTFAPRAEEAQPT